jgi:hypothetical protein
MANGLSSESEMESGLILRSLDRIGTSADWFTARLDSNGIRLHPESVLQVGLSTLRDFRSKALAGTTLSFESAEQAYEYFSVAIGADFLTKALHWGGEAGLILPIERWKFLKSGDPFLTRPAPRSHERDRTWETVLASLTATFASNVEFNEPDVTSSFKGRTFAIALKSSYSDNNVISAIEDGFKQADGKAEASLVILNVANIYPLRDEFHFSKFRKYADDSKAADVMINAIGRWCGDWNLASLARRLRTKATQPIGVAFFVPLLLQMRDHPCPLFYTHMPLRWSDADSPDYEFTTAFLHSCNDVLGFSSARPRRAR